MKIKLWVALVFVCGVMMFTFWLGSKWGEYVTHYEYRDCLVRSNFI